MSVVAVTGVGGYMGRLVLSAVEGLDGVRRVVGIDSEPARPGRRMEFYRCDVRDREVREILAPCDVVVHCAWSGGRRRGCGTNVAGVAAVLEAAPNAQHVYISCATVYGAHLEGDDPLTETSPVRPIVSFPPSSQHAEAERLLGPGSIVLRPCPVVGPQMSGSIRRVLESPISLSLRGYDPSVQLLHETDFITAVATLVAGRHDGIFNVAPDDALALRDVWSCLGRPHTRVSYDAAARRLRRLAFLGLVDLNAGFVPFLAHPWAVSNAKLRALGWTPAHDCRSALAVAAEQVRGRVSIGGLRLRPRRTAAVAALAASAAVIGLARKQNPER